MANRMAPAMANRMAKLMANLWQNDAPNPNPNPNPNTQLLLSRLVFQGGQDRIRSNGDLGRFGFGLESR